MEEWDECQHSDRNSSDLGQMEPGVKKMRSIILTQCLPITNIQDLNSIIEEPPRWVNRVEPLARRSQFVVQNSIADCHSEANRFIPRRKLEAKTVPKTLVCHDYKGGYQADKYLHFAHERIPGNGYTFYNWAQIDIFVYFSHHLITIPPLCWINMGHTNGVKVLGTLITEFDPGSELCNKQFFRNTESMRAFAGSLAEVTRIFNFDGWLLNIENVVDNIDILKEFVPYLTQLLHENNPENLVIWYDSVTVEGGLQWQNELNDNNRYFFDNCDGIFLNYGWTENHLINTVEAAKHRHLDVFVGIDVFGRNMYGGGKFNTFKAAELVNKYNLSMALFAPGWTHETLPKSDTFFEQFLSKDSAFWCSLWPYLHSHPITSNFFTNFYIGLDKTCYNVIGQQQQLSIFPHPKNANAIQEYWTIPTLNRRCGCIEGAIVGSRNCCLITRHNLEKNLDYIHHLFVCDLEIVNNTVVYFMTKSLDANLVTLTITLLVSCSNHSLRIIRLLGTKKEELIDNASLLEVNRCEAVDIVDSIKNRHHKLIVEDSWTLNAYIFNTKRCLVLEIGATLDNGDSVLLGAFGIQSADGNFLKNSHGIVSSY